ncbi:MAG: hypothetical protein HY682_00350 [Chloroflexi bacterium]|nr:hypothetical protein [Chloroflexota bacterium]
MISTALACGTTPPTPVPTAKPAPIPTMPVTMMGTGAAMTSDYAPLVRGFYQGGEVQFIHTEASDSQVAGMLTRMMGPGVQVVPGLATVPAGSLSAVYVFTDGVSGDGPFGFQADVFDSVPTDPGYSPLRSLHLVSWKPTATPRLFRSAAEVRDAEAKGEVTIEKPGVVINMPVLVWPGGHR